MGSWLEVKVDDHNSARKCSVLIGTHPTDVYAASHRETAHTRREMARLHVALFYIFCDLQNYYFRGKIQ